MSREKDMRHMRSLAMTVLALLLSAAIATAGEWMTSKEGARLWNANPQPNESCSWTGNIDKDGYATGEGVIVWFEDGKVTQISVLALKQGKHEEGVRFVINRQAQIAIAYVKNDTVQPLELSLQPSDAADIDAKRNATESRQSTKVEDKNKPYGESVSIESEGKDVFGVKMFKYYINYYEKGLIRLHAPGWTGQINYSSVEFFETYLDGHINIFKKSLDWYRIAKEKDEDHFEKILGDIKSGKIDKTKEVFNEFHISIGRNLGNDVSFGLKVYKTIKENGKEIERNMTADFTEENVNFFVKNLENFSGIREKLKQHKISIESYK
jgi:hypothetical protein